MITPVAGNPHLFLYLLITVGKPTPQFVALKYIFNTTCRGRVECACSCSNTTSWTCKQREFHPIALTSTGLDAYIGAWILSCALSGLLLLPASRFTGDSRRLKKKKERRNSTQSNRSMVGRKLSSQPHQSPQEEAVSNRNEVVRAQERALGCTQQANLISKHAQSIGEPFPSSRSMTRLEETTRHGSDLEGRETHAFLGSTPKLDRQVCSVARCIGSQKW